jgi:hypothetical protein
MYDLFVHPFGTENRRSRFIKPFSAMSHPRFDASACANSLADLLASWQTYFKYSVHYLGSSLDNQPLTEEERFEHQAEVCGVLLLVSHVDYLVAHCHLIA